MNGVTCTPGESSSGTDRTHLEGTRLSVHDGFLEVAGGCILDSS